MIRWIFIIIVVGLGLVLATIVVTNSPSVEPLKNLHSESNQTYNTYDYFTALVKWKQGLELARQRNYQQAIRMFKKLLQFLLNEGDWAGYLTLWKQQPALASELGLIVNRVSDMKPDYKTNITTERKDRTKKNDGCVLAVIQTVSVLAAVIILFYWIKTEWHDAKENVVKTEVSTRETEPVTGKNKQLYNNATVKIEVVPGEYKQFHNAVKRLPNQYIEPGTIVRTIWATDKAGTRQRIKLEFFVAKESSTNDYLHADNNYFDLLVSVGSSVKQGTYSAKVEDGLILINVISVFARMFSNQGQEKKD